MPGLPVSRPHASAMCTAAASCRTCTRSSFASIAASKIDMMWLPESVNTRSHPNRASERATMSAPRSPFSSVIPKTPESGSKPLERVIDVPGLIDAELRITPGPLLVQVLQRIERQHLGFSLALVEQLLDAIVRGHQHGAEFLDVFLIRERAVTDDHL